MKDSKRRTLIFSGGKRAFVCDGGLGGGIGKENPKGVSDVWVDPEQSVKSRCE